MERPPRHARAARALARAIFALALVGVVFPLRADDSGEVALVRVRNADAGGLLMVEATVGGERSRWLIDTGSSEHLIAAAFADQLGLRGEAAVTLRTPVGAQRGERVTLPELQLGAARLAGLPAVRVDLQPLVGSLGMAVDGVLGAPLLAGRQLRLDLARQTLVLRAAGAAACSDPARRVELASHRGVPLVRLDSAAGRGQTHLLDTGNPG
ncbi:MAG TPA: retropepsin-like aspartic protease, partial [Ideonella sp.]|nr:retropepsin-like aspartic protease [Ideonella sp.]